jgi:HNH endonuclease
MPSSKSWKTHCKRGHEFAPTNTGIDRRGRRYCKICKADRQRAWQSANRERMAELQREWRAANPEIAKAIARRAAAKQRAKPGHKAKAHAYYDSNRDRFAALNRRWKAENPERVRVHTARRRARKKNAPLVEDVDRFAIYDRDGGRCHICGRNVSRSRFVLDHLVPLSRGGEHSARNVATAHPRCNGRRHAGVLPAQLRLVG